MQFNKSMIFIILAIMLYSCPATADNRADNRSKAKEIVSSLEKAGINKSMVSEFSSLTTTIKIADNYYSINEKNIAEKYYQLALQKAGIIMASIPDGSTRFPEVTLEPSLPTEKPLKNQDTNSKPAVKHESSIPVPEESNLSNPQTSDMKKKESVETSDSKEEQKNENNTEMLKDNIVSDKIIGNTGIYTVVKGDSLSLVSAKLGVSREHLAIENKLGSSRVSLRTGQKLKYNNRKIIPKRLKNGIVINVPDRTLYYFKNGKLETALPVALGVPVVNEKYDWRTPLGKFKITAKIKEPTWYVPTSIQSEMEERGKEVITSIPPGPDNPLGQYAMKTSLPGILIHSTIRPGSVYGFASHGCIRVYPDRMEELFKEVKVSTQGEIIYRPVKVTLTENGAVLLEVHKDVYNHKIILAKEARELLEKHKLTDMVDWKKVEQVIRNKAGIAQDVTLYKP